MLQAVPHQIAVKPVLFVSVFSKDTLFHSPYIAELAFLVKRVGDPRCVICQAMILVCFTSVGLIVLGPVLEVDNRGFATRPHISGARRPQLSASARFFDV